MDRARVVQPKSIICMFWSWLAACLPELGDHASELGSAPNLPVIPGCERQTPASNTFPLSCHMLHVCMGPASRHKLHPIIATLILLLGQQPSPHLPPQHN